MIWWAGSYDAKDSPLGRLLFDKDDDGNIAAFGSRPAERRAARARLAELRDRGARRDRASRTRRSAARVRWELPRRRPANALSLASFERGIDWTWRRTSFSDITAGSYEATVASEPRERVLGDEPAEASAPAAEPGEDEERLRSVRSRFGTLPVGLGFGTLVHRAARAHRLRGARPRGGARPAARRTAVARSPPWEPIGEELVGALAPRSRRRSAPRSTVCRLRDLAPAIGSTSSTSSYRSWAAIGRTGTLTLDAIATSSRAPTTIAFAPTPDRLSDPSLRQSVRGYLAGSIDLVGRIDGGGPTPVLHRRLQDELARRTPGEELTAWHYRPHALSVEMARHHYLLQGTLYAAALHRYLRWRVPGLRPGPRFRRGPLPVPARDERSRDARASTGSPAASSPGSRRRRCSTS